MLKSRSALPICLVVLVGHWAGPAVFGKEPEVITNSIEMKLVLIPAGHFMMGTEEKRTATLHEFPYCDPKWLDGELPSHKVRITKPFYLGQCEVTLGQFLTFYREAKYKLEIERDGKPSWGYDKDGKTLIESSDFRPWAPGWKIEPDHPAVYVSWNDATAFCQWLSKREHKKYRLPTEAEWEYACRAGSKSRYAFGDNPEELVRWANASDQDRKSLWPGEHATLTAFDEEGNPKGARVPFPFLSGRDGYAWTAPVGRFPPNAFGLHDMHGNVWEWCSDWHSDLYYENTGVDDPQGPESGVARVARGGGFDDTPVHLRSAYRDDDEPSDRDCHNGFRVVCER